MTNTTLDLTADHINEQIEAKAHTYRRGNLPFNAGEIATFDTEDAARAALGATYSAVTRVQIGNVDYFTASDERGSWFVVQWAAANAEYFIEIVNTATPADRVFSSTDIVTADRLLIPWTRMTAARHSVQDPPRCRARANNATIGWGDHV